MKKKLALGTTVLAVLASVVPTHVAPVEAAGNTIYVSYNSNGGIDAGGGTGSETSPFNQLRDAIANAQNGDTIIIKGKAFVNDIGSKSLPLYIDKEVTIKSLDNTLATMDVRAGGIVLGANVTFENIEFSFANKVHDAIFANGHTLNLINVVRGRGTRQVDLFAGGPGTLTNNSVQFVEGNSPAINVITNGNFKGNGLKSEFGGIYAGSMNSDYDKSAKIKVSNTGSVGILKVEGIYSSGAWEADPGEIFDLNEPLPPQADPSRLPVHGNVNITLENLFPAVNGDTGSSATTTVTASAKNLSTLNIENVSKVHLTSGTIKLPTSITTVGLEKVSVDEDTILDLTGLTGELNVREYTGNGSLIFPSSGLTLNLEQDFSTEDETTLLLNGYNPYSYNGNATVNQVYITTPSQNATINYEPSFADQKLKLEPVVKNSRVEWTVVDPNSKPSVPDEEEKEGQGLPSITQFTVAQDEATKNVQQEDYSSNPYHEVTYNIGVSTDSGDDEEEVWLTDYENDLVVTVNGQPAQYVDNDGVLSYYNEDEKIDIYLEPGEEPRTQRVVVSFRNGDMTPVTPTKDKYVIRIGTEDVAPVELTLNIGEEQEEQEPATPTQPVLKEFITDGFKTTKTFSESEFTSHDEPTTFFTFKVDAEGERVLLSDYEGLKVTINGKSTDLVEHDDNHLYYFAHDEMVKAYFELDEETGEHKLVVLSYDGEGPAIPKESKYDIEISYPDVEPLTLTMEVVPDEEESIEPTPPTTEGGDTGGGSSGGGNSGITNPPTTEDGDTGGDSSGGGNSGTTNPPTPPTQEPTPPTVEDKENRVDNFNDLSKELQEKVDSLMTDILVEENGVILDLVGDDDDLSNVDTLEVTSEGLFINVDGEKVKFNTSLDLSNIDWDNTRVIRLGGGAVPHKQNGEGLTITTSNFNNLLITSKEPEPFTDVNDDDWFKEYVEDAYNYGFTEGTTATTFSPNDTITRAQLAVMLARAFELEPTSDGNTLSDIGDKWYASEVQALFDAGIIKGFGNGTFGGEEKLTRQQAVTMLVNMLKYLGVNTSTTKDVQFADLDKIGGQAQDAVKYLASQDVLVNGEDVNFNPYNNLTRAQMSKMLVRSLRLSNLY